jgi:hypothetical protein
LTIQCHAVAALHTCVVVVVVPINRLLPTCLQLNFHCHYSATMPPKNATPTSENEVHEEAITARKFPRNAKWVPADDATLVDTLKAFADGNSADNGTFKTVAFTTAAKSLKDSHKLSGGAPKTAKTCSRRWATVSMFFFLIIHANKFIVAEGQLSCGPEAS